LTDFVANTLDVDGNLPAAADGSTTILMDGTTLTLTENNGGLVQFFQTQAPPIFILRVKAELPANIPTWFLT